MKVTARILKYYQKKTCCEAVEAAALDAVEAAALIAASMYDEYSVGLCIPPVCTRCGFAMTYKIQVCSDLP
jgi:predicted Zn-ribbon and HTH transcriptional regulator